MFTIGIVDLTTVGSTIAQRRISELGGPLGEHPEFAVHSLPFVEYRKAILNSDWKLMAQLIKTSIDKLNRIGVDFIIVPSNTPHYAYEEFRAGSRAPVLNLIDTTVTECKRLGLKRVAVLGTMQTMTGGLYDEKLRRQGVEPVIPDARACEIIQEYIIEDLIPGKNNPGRRDAVLQEVNKLECDGFILGCTELPEVYSEVDFKGRKAIDTTRLLAEKAFDVAKHHKAELLDKYRS